jgi:TolB protein
MKWNERMISLWKNSAMLVRWIPLLMLLLWPTSSKAEIKYFDLTNPYLHKIPMAVPVFKAATPAQVETALVASVADKVQGMLEFTGYFKMLDRGSFLYNPQTSGITLDKLNFANWKTVGAELLITGGVQVSGQDIVLELRLFDTFKAKLLVGRRYSGKIKDQRTMIRRFCTEVIQALTGNTGIFDSRLVFVSNGSGHKEIYMCDFDGTNIRQVTKKRSITSFPAWSSDNRHLAFTSFSGGPARIFIRNLRSGKENRVRYKGLQTAPSWMPGRFEVSATLNFGGDEEIYLLTGSGKMIKRLTKSRGIDVEASWSPDGKKMAFVSNRSGRPQIYIKEVNNGRVQRITFKGKYNTQPCWSPKGDFIAYSSMENGRQNIFIIDIDGNNPIQLTSDQGDNEAPSWSPDGSLIAFSSNREGRSRIYVMTAYGTDQRRLLNLPGEQIQPKWSSNIPQ